MSTAELCVWASDKNLHRHGRPCGPRLKPVVGLLDCCGARLKPSLNIWVDLKVFLGSGTVSGRAMWPAPFLKIESAGRRREPRISCSLGRAWSCSAMRRGAPPNLLKVLLSRLAPPGSRALLSCLIALPLTDKRQHLAAKKDAEVLNATISSSNVRPGLAWPASCRGCTAPRPPPPARHPLLITSPRCCQRRAQQQLALVSGWQARPAACCRGAVLLRSK